MSTLFDWTPEKIDYYKRAADYTGFFRRLVEFALPFFGADDEVVDLGCGLGLFDIMLAPHVRHIDAIDLHPEAIADLIAALAEKNIENVNAVVSDSADVISPPPDGKEWDVIFMSFFGEGSNTFDLLLKQARKRVVMITHNDDKPRGCAAPPVTRRLSNAVAIAGYLDERGVIYRRSDHSLNFGQPLKSRSDAKKFAACYAAKGGSERVLSELMAVDGGEYRYFLPKERNISLFVVDTGAGFVLR